MRNFILILISIPCLGTAATLVQGCNHIESKKTMKENVPRQEASLSVEIDTGDVICRRFLGFGAEWDSRGYLKSGITKKDFATIRRRVEWMRLPVARIMMQCKWCYKGGGEFNWHSEEMKSLYRHLDVCQRLGTTVFLADWGCEPKWLQCPDVKSVNDPKYAQIIGSYMDYLLNRKGYTCIKYFIMVNEPNYEVKDWSRWKKGVENLFSEFKERGLEKKVKIAGADHSNADNWHKNAVDQLHDILGSYDIHRYAKDRNVRVGKLEDYFQKSWSYALKHDKKASLKPFVVGEAGLNDYAQHPRGNQKIDSIYYGIFMADYAVQAVNAGSWAVIAWMLDDNSHAGFYWGMWKNKDKDLELRPWFYPWSLLCRYFPPESSIVRTKITSKEVRVLAAYCNHEGGSDKRSWSFCLVNRSEKPRTIRLHLTKGSRFKMKRYVYSEASAKKDANGFPVPLDYHEYDLGAGADVLCERKSVVILTSLKLR